MLYKLTGLVFLLLFFNFITAETESLITLSSGIGLHQMAVDETVITDYAILKNDPVGKLTDQFTICNSIFVEYVTTSQDFFTLYTKNGKPWITIKLLANKNLTEFTEFVHIVLNRKINVFFGDSGIQVNPHSWYTGCLGLDTVTGHLRIA